MKRYRTKIKALKSMMPLDIKNIYIIDIENKFYSFKLIFIEIVI